MTGHRSVGAGVAWQVVLFAVITLSCIPTQEQELEPAGMQPGCGVGIPAELTASNEKTKKPKKPKKAHPSQTPCDFGPRTTLDLLVMYDTALLQLATEEAISEWIHQRVNEANEIFANSGASRISYELRAIRPVSARLSDTWSVAPGQSRVRIKEILYAWVRDELSILSRHRDAYGADLAVFVTTPYRDRLGTGEGDVCGVATLPIKKENKPEVEEDDEYFLVEPLVVGSSKHRSFNEEAFAVLEYRCGASEGRNDLTFAHELGHTFGMSHSVSDFYGREMEEFDPVRPFAFGTLLYNPGRRLATVMACSPGGSVEEVPLGVCNRIPHFSSAHVKYSSPGCNEGEGEHCDWETGNGNFDNARVACERAPMYAAFREPSRNEPPTVEINSVREVGPGEVLRDVGTDVPSGTTVELTAVATDPQEGDLTSRIQWLDHRGEVIGTGRTLRVPLLQAGDFPVSARVADSGGLVDEWALPLRVTSPPTVFPRVGPWYNPERSGHGIDFQRTPDGKYAVLWYTYRPDGSPTWYITGAAPIDGARWRAPLHASTSNGSTNTLEPVGTLEMSFSSDARATLFWSFTGTGVQGSEPFRFESFDNNITGVAHGTWYPPSEPGWGASIWHYGNVGVITAYTYDASGQPTWAQGRAEGDPGAWVFGVLNQFTAKGLCPSCSGSSYDTLEPVGTASFRLTDPTAGTGMLSIDLTYRAATGSWRRTNVPFVRLTAP